MGYKRRGAASPNASDPSRYKFTLPAEIKRRGLGLLDQELWCLGCDVRRPEGNLLIARGFQRDGLPADLKGSSCYYLCDPDGAEVRMWGFGLYYSCAGSGGVLIQRFEFEPRLSAETSLPLGVYAPEAMPPMLAPADPDQGAAASDRLAHLAGWLADYEAWIVQTVGAAYREDCLRDWAKKNPFAIPASQMQPAWRAIADQLAQTR